VSPGKSVAFFVTFLAACSPSVRAQPVVTATLSNVTRIEGWSYFQPTLDPLAITQAAIGDPDYVFVGDRAELGVRVEGSRFDLGGAFNYVRLENLPGRAIGPGGLGNGAFYFAASGVRYSYQLYMSELTVKVKSRRRAMAVTFGRMPFSSGAGVLMPDRLSSRLVGNFESSLYQRRFDGVRIDVGQSTTRFTAAAFVPTQGGFEESTNLSMPRVQIGAAEWTRSAGGAQYQAFAYGYRDRRRNTAVVDNTASRDRPAAIGIATVGGSYARVSPTRSGELDALAWGAVQAGDWYGRTHRAASVALEGGHRWIRAAMKPWLRAGYLWASGDRDRRDARHATFFPMLPSSRQYALSSVFTQMNLRDAFAQLSIEPRRFRARIEVHDVRVASGADLWYHGSGATASDDRFFGFSGRFAGGATSLGTVVEGTVDVPIRKPWSISAYAATMTAGGVVRQFFTDKRLLTWSIDNVIRF